MPRYSAEQIYAYALQAGFDPHSATTMTAVAMAESRGSSDAHATHGEDSRGLWQINARAHPDLARRYDLWNPADNARAAFEISRGGADVSPWTTTHGGTRASYLRFRHDAQAAAVAHGDQPGLGVWTGTRGYGHALAASPDLRGSHQHPSPTPAAADDATALHATGAGDQASGSGDHGAGTAGDVSGLHVDLAPAPAPATPAAAPDPHPGDPGAAPTVAEQVAEQVLAQQTVVTAVVPLDDKDPAVGEAPAAPASPAPASGAEPSLVVPVQASSPGDLPEHPGIVTHLTAEQLVRLDAPPAPLPHPVQQAAVVPHPLTVLDPATLPPVAAEVTHEAAAGQQAHDSQALDRFMEVAAAQKGDAYVMGAQARLSDPNPSVFDCAELVRWSAHQAGVNLPDGSWLQYLHLKQAGAIIPVEQAKHTRGALLFSFSSEPTPGGGRPSHSHVAISDGEGHTIEARGRAYGVGSWDTKHRFGYAAIIPGLDGPAPATQPAPAHDAGHPAGHSAGHSAGQGGGHASGGLVLDVAPAPAQGGALIDTDGDGLADELERSLGLDPHHADTDGDGLRDARELLYTHTDPLVADAPADRFDAVLDSSVHEIQPAPAPHQPAHEPAHHPDHGHGHADPGHPGGTTAPGLTLEHPLLDDPHHPQHGPQPDHHGRPDHEGDHGQHGQHDQHGQHGQHGHDGHGGGHGW